MSLADVTANLRAPIVTRVADAPTVRVHSVEWRKVQAGEPVEINPSVRDGAKEFGVASAGAGGMEPGLRALAAGAPRRRRSGHLPARRPAPPCTGRQRPA